jgi:hypothetical protein
MLTNVYAHLSFAWSSWTYRREVAYWRRVELRAVALNPTVKLSYVARACDGTPQAVFWTGQGYLTVQRQLLDFSQQFKQHVALVVVGRR